MAFWNEFFTSFSANGRFVVSISSGCLSSSLGIVVHVHSNLDEIDLVPDRVENLRLRLAASQRNLLDSIPLEVEHSFPERGTVSTQKYDSRQEASSSSAGFHTPEAVDDEMRTDSIAGFSYPVSDDDADVNAPSLESIFRPLAEIPRLMEEITVLSLLVFSLRFYFFIFFLLVEP